MKNKSSDYYKSMGVEFVADFQRCLNRGRKFTEHEIEVLLKSPYYQHLTPTLKTIYNEFINDWVKENREALDKIAA